MQPQQSVHEHKQMHASGCACMQVAFGQYHNLMHTWVDESRLASKKCMYLASVNQDQDVH